MCFTNVLENNNFFSRHIMVENPKPKEEKLKKKQLIPQLKI